MTGGKNQRTRESRKLEHIKTALKLADGPGTSGFEDLHLIHNCLPELAPAEISLETELAGLKLSSPLVINAMTGGSPEVEQINAALARAARRLGLAMAVGSQRAALDAARLEDTFSVVRHENPDGIIFANVGADTSPEKADQAVAMIGAQALQVHLNSAQELTMVEGDRDFRGWAENVKAICKSVRVPVIAKEVGFGVARSQAIRLAETGVRAIDVGGKGGTNFVAIESLRKRAQVSWTLVNWGIPTAITLAETLDALKTVPEPPDVMASGGIRSPLCAAKALAVGARSVGIAGLILQILAEEGEEALAAELRRWHSELRTILALVGARDLAALRLSPVVFTGFTREWLDERGVDTVSWTRRA